MTEAKNMYIFEYLDENDFRKKERSVRKYNMLAYKKLTFDYYPKLRKGEFLGELIKEDEKTKTKTYELKLPTDEFMVKSDFIIQYILRKKLFYLLILLQKVF